MPSDHDTASPSVTRFAPSPTGHLHIGGARTALFCWVLARRTGGRFVLRIEDTDRARSSEDAARGILDDLAWLGLEWDDGPTLADPEGRQIGGDSRSVGPFYQSQRLDTYQTFFDRLIEAGLAYPAFDTPEELAAKRTAAEKEKRTFIYRRDPNADPSADLARAASEPHVLRFAMPPEPVIVRDRVLGEVTFPYEELDDFIIRKRDGMPTYHFAVVVDDALMGVNRVLRGQEHLNNTPKHVALQRALGVDTPDYAHLPLIFNPDGTKMSKRDKDKAAKKACKADKLNTSPVADVDDETYNGWLKDKQRQLGRDDLVALAAKIGLELPEIDVEDFRAAGYLPEVLLNYLALLGWNPGAKNDDGTDLERFDTAYLAEHFDLARVGRSPSKFDRDKLLAFNAHTIQHQLDDDAFAELWLGWARRFDASLASWGEADATRWSTAAHAARPRAKTLRDAKRSLTFVFQSDNSIEYQAKAVKKVLLKDDGAGLAVLRDLGSVLAALPAWTPMDIEGAISSFAESRGLGMGQVAQPLRVAITGTGVSPALGETLGLLTREAAIARIDRCQREAPGA